MSATNRADPHYAQHLMMAALDGELLGEEAAELERLLARDAGLREEWEQLNRVKQVAGGLSLRPAPTETWNLYWESVYNRLERGVGWFLTALGLALGLFYSVWFGIVRVITADRLPWPLKLALLALLVGGAVLVVSVLREKWFVARDDPYKDIQR